MPGDIDEVNIIPDKGRGIGVGLVEFCVSETRKYESLVRQRAHGRQRWAHSDRTKIGVLLSV